jgi:hypothetical protein
MITGVRLRDLSLAARITLTAFLFVVGCGYLVALAKIYTTHHAADGVPGMSLDDLRAVYHGLDRTVTGAPPALPSPMLKQVSPGGKMRKKLLKGGESAERALVTWLKQGAKVETFAQAGLAQQGDPSARQVIADRCIECHNSATGEERETPYADTAEAEPRFDLVARKSTPPVVTASESTRVLHFERMNTLDLLQVTHAHIITIPLFALVIAVLFLHTGLGSRMKLLIAPLPLLATCVDLGCWWLARPWEPAIYGIAAAGLVFGVALALQMLCVLGSTWFGRKSGSLAGR